MKKAKFTSIKVLVNLRARTLALVASCVADCVDLLSAYERASKAICAMAREAFNVEPEDRAQYWNGIRAEFANQIRAAYPKAWARNDKGKLVWCGKWAQVAGARLSEITSLIKWSVDHDVSIPKNLQESQAEYTRMLNVIRAAKPKQSEKPKAKDAVNKAALEEYPSINEFAKDLAAYAAKTKDNAKIVKLIQKLRAEFLVQTTIPARVQTLAEAERAQRIGQ